MGYCMDLIEQKFRIQAAKKEAAFAAVRELIYQTDKMSGGRWKHGKLDQKWYAWTSTEALQTARTLEQFCAEWRWEMDQDEDGSICGINFTGEKMGDDMVLFEALAPFVEPGSYINMRGEDGAHWQWYFDGKTVKEKPGEITYFDPDDD